MVVLVVKFVRVVMVKGVVLVLKAMRIVVVGEGWLWRL